MVHRDASGTVVVGGRVFTEALILGNIYSQMIQRRNRSDGRRKFNLDGTLVTMSAQSRAKSTCSPTTPASSRRTSSTGHVHRYR
ncbi:MAG: hypothetical protein ACLT4Y_07820 [Bifidobacterium breve]